MLQSTTIDTERAALLVMDYQVDIVARIANGEPDLLQRTAAVLAAARGAGMPVIYIVVGFRPSFPEVSERNVTFRTLKSTGDFAPGPGTEIDPAVAPQTGDIVVQKHRVGAFFGTDLDMILRANDVETLVLCGLSTSGVVLSTLRYAADADYGLVVIEDCCADPNIDVHRCLMDSVFPRQARIVSAEQFVEAAGAGA